MLPMWDSSVISCVAVIDSVSLLYSIHHRNIPHSRQSILLMSMWDVCRWWLLGIVLLWAFVYMSFGEWTFAYHFCCMSFLGAPLLSFGGYCQLYKVNVPVCALTSCAPGPCHLVLCILSLFPPLCFSLPSFPPFSCSILVGVPGWPRVWTFLRSIRSK